MGSHGAVHLVGRHLKFGRVFLWPNQYTARDLARLEFVSKGKHSSKHMDTCISYEEELGVAETIKNVHNSSSFSFTCGLP